MTIDQWWTRLAPRTRERLVADNGDRLPADVVREIIAAGGAVQADDHLTDDETDWIEAVANDEAPA